MCSTGANVHNSSKHDSPKYGQWYTPEEIIDLFAPSQTAVATVSEWLQTAGIEASRIGQSVNKQWIQFDATVEEAETLLRTEYFHFEHAATGKKTVACNE